MNYPDLEFASSLVIQGEHSRESSLLLREVPHPLTLSLVHRLQIENALLRSLHSSNRSEAVTARAGMRIWRQYLDEEIFVIAQFDLELAFAKAAGWNAACTIQPPRWGLLLHPAIAAVSRSVFMSFNPALRKQAADDGLRLLPSSL